ncbi:MAG: putative porin [Leptothrix sp. (in: b-proteobacteria)]
MNRLFARTLTPLLLVGALTPALAAEPSASAAPASADARLIELLVEQGVISRAKADAYLKDSKDAKDAPSAAGAPVRVPYVPGFVRDEIKSELRAELKAQAEREGWAGPGAVPDWVRRISFDGDLRVRYQRDDFASNNAIDLSVSDTNRNRSLTLLNTSVDRQRLRVRGRFGLTAIVDDSWSVGLRLSTGSATDPLSENQTLGTSGNRLPVAFDRAYVRYRSGEAFNVVAGRIGNPWFGTDLVWASDLGFDGVAAQWTPQLSADTRAFATLAALPIQEVELSNRDKWLFGAQVGADAVKVIGDAGAKVGLGFYKYANVVGRKDPAGGTLNEFTAPGFAQKGNTYYDINSDATRPNATLFGLASDYRLLNLTAALDVPLAPGISLLPTLDLVRNLGFERAAVSARVGEDVAPKTRGQLLRVAIGSHSIAKVGDWQVSVSHKRVERDAVLDAYTDSDFHLGGTDAKGFILGGSYGVGRNAALTARILSAKAIDGPPLDINVMQLDLSVRF